MPVAPTGGQAVPPPVAETSSRDFEAAPIQSLFTVIETGAWERAQDRRKSRQYAKASATRSARILKTAKWTIAEAPEAEA